MTTTPTKTIEVWFYSGQKRIFDNIVDMVVVNNSQMRLADMEERDILLNWVNINFIVCQDVEK